MHFFVFKLGSKSGVENWNPHAPHLSISSYCAPPRPPASYPKLLDDARFEPFVVGIQEDLICPPLLPINLDEDGRVGAGFLQISCPDPKGPRKFYNKDQGTSGTPRAREGEGGGGNQVIGTGVDTQMCPFLEPIKQVVNMKAPYCLINA